MQRVCAQCLSGSTLGTRSCRRSERHPRVPSAALGPHMGPPWQGPGQQWLPVMTATLGCLLPSWQPGDWGCGAAPPSVTLQQGAFRPQGPGWATCFRLSIPLHPLPLPPLFPGLPLVPTRQEMGGKLGEGGVRAPLPRSGVGCVCPPHPGPAADPALQQSGRLPFHIQGAALLKARIPKGLGLSGERNKRNLLL